MRTLLLSLLIPLFQTEILAAPITAATKEVSSQATTYAIQVDGPDSLWKIESTEPWVSVSRSKATGDANIDITVSRNDSGLVRTAVVKVAGLHHLVTQHPSESGRLELWAMGSDAYGQLGAGRIFVSKRPTPFPLASDIAACAAGSVHTLFLKKNKTLWSFGGNNQGQLGQSGASTLIGSDEAIQVASDVSAIAAGGSHSLYLKSDGSLWGMGDNLNGQLGDGTAIDRPLPVKITTGVTAIAAGGVHSLFLKTDGSLWAMGYNSQGQLGIGSTQSLFTPTRIATSVIAISASGGHSLFIKSDHTLWAMGRNTVSQLGDGTTVNRTSPVQIASQVARAAAGESYSVWVDNSGALWRAGDGDELPRKIGSGVSSVEAGLYHFIYIKNDGSLWGEGRNYEGQLGSSYFETGVPATKLADNVKSASAGGYHTAYITGDDTLWVCGSDEQGQLGIGGARRIQPLHIMSDVTGVAADEHTLFLGKNGSVSTAGDNTHSALGDGSTTRRSIPIHVASDAIAVAAGLGNSLILQRSGTVLAMGRNQGAFGDGVRLSRSFPTPVANDVTAITAGIGQTFFLKGDVLWGCGEGLYGQLGDGAPLYSGNRLTPVQITQNVASMSAGNYHSMVLKKDGTLWGTGENSSGQLGDGTKSMRNTLVQIATDVSTVSAGGYFTIFIKKDGTLWGMGGNTNGALGDGTTIDRAKPVKLAEDVTQISAGGSHYLFIKRDRSLWACGSNFYGQLGDGSIISRTTPVKIAESVVAIEAGSFTSFFITIDKTPPPQIALQPASADVISGQTATFRVNASGPGLAYQWHYGTSGDASNPIPGADASVLQLSPLTQDVTVWVRITNEGGSVDSTVASGLVYQTQTIDFSPLSNRYIGSASFELEATASNGGPVTFSASGPATLQTNLLVLGRSPGLVTVVAHAPASGRYLAATLERRFYLLSIPTLSLVLDGLSQMYDGTPRHVTVSGGVDGLVPVVTYNGSLNPPHEVGIYTVEAVLGSNLKKGTLSIRKRPLSVLVNDCERAIRQPNPPFALTYSGFVPGDDISALDHPPGASTKATISSPPGVYPITVSQGSDNHYEFVLERPAYLTVVGFGGTYETLLLDASGIPLGKLEFTAAANALTYTGTLHLASESGPVTIASNVKIPASLLSPLSDGSGANATWTRIANPAKSITALSLRIDLAGHTLGATLTRPGLANLSGSGSRVFTQSLDAKKKKLPAPWTGAHTLVLRDPASLGSSDSRDLPLGAGHASAPVAATGVLKLAGRLADGAALTGSFKPDTAGRYRVFVRPYAKRRDSALAGQLALVAHPDQTRFPARFHIPEGGTPEGDTELFWSKAALPSTTKASAQDKFYVAGFDTAVVAILDPWIAPAAKPTLVNGVTLPAGNLAQRLSLTDLATETTTLSPAFFLPAEATFGARAGFLPATLNLSAKGAFTVPAPLPAKADNPAFSLKVTPATGAFSGSFTLSDVIPPATRPIIRKVTISGTLRQAPASPSSGGDLASTSAPVAHGHLLFDPIPGDTGPAATKQISGDFRLLGPAQ